MQQNLQQNMLPAHPRRTSKACTTCHARKTRCDALSTGLPCTNCREGGFECLLQPRKKRQSKLAARLVDYAGHGVGSGPGRVGDATSSTTHTQMRAQQTQPTQQTIETQPALTPTPRVAFPEHVMRHQIPHFSFFSRLALVGKASASVTSATSATSATSTATTSAAAAAREQHDGRDLVLPIAPYNQSAGGPAHDQQARAEDEQFLRRKGAFTLPPRAALDDCVATYFCVFHPFFPVVDRPAFLALYRPTPSEDLVRGNGRPRPSLLLLQSLVFTASAFVSMERLNEMGFSSRHQARTALHSRAKYLHQFGWEQDDIATIQSLLLMSHDYASMADQRHTWLWAHQAIGLAQGAGLHRACQADENSDASRLWRRIWWACLVRDRLIALGTRRPMHINSLDCSVPLPTAADLAEAGDTDDDRATKAIFADFLKLCHYVEGILSLAYVAEGHGGQDASPAPASLAREVTLCRSTLANWAANLSPPSRRVDTTETVTAVGDGSIPFLYQTLLHLMHNVVVTTLLQTGGSMYDDPLAGPRVPSTEMQRLAQDSTRLLDGLLQRSLVHYCPTQTVTAVMPALIVQFLLMRGTTDDAAQQDATRGFTTCMAALGALGHTYWHAQFYHDFFQLAAAAGRPRTRTRTSRRQEPRRSRHGKTSKRTKDTTPTPPDTMSPPNSLDHNVDPVLCVQSQQPPPPPPLPPPPPPLKDNSEPPWPAGNWIETDPDPAVGGDVVMADNAVPVLWNDDGNGDLWTAHHVTLFDDWLHDDALFQSLFPSA